MMMIN